MSWYMCFDIYTKTKGVWTNRIHDKDFSMLKNLCDTRGTLMQEITTSNLDDVDLENLNVLVHEYDRHDSEYRGCLKREEWEKLDIKSRVICEEGTAKDCGILIDESDVKKITFASASDYMNDTNKDDYVNIYTESVEERGYGQGQFYDQNSFYSLEKDLKKKYKELIIKRYEWERMKTSLEYCKLSDEEKENVSSEFEYLDEDIQETEFQIIAINQFCGILEMYSDYDTKVVAYVYCD